ncbi:MAG TPA: hypothetical protein VM328_00440, partial [Fimbriimonadaceae bacterium]|nr:hypothetical protein [Fimbriimonadaceae bacterium]
MSLLFVASACAGGLYFGLAQRRFDFLAVGFLSAVVYFLPGFLGITLYPLGGSHLAPLELSEGTYLAMALVLLTILATALAFDALVPPDRRPAVHLLKAEWLPEVATVLAAAGFGWTVLSSGSSLLDSNKAVMMASLGPGFTLWEVGAEVGLISSFVLRRRWCLAICGLLLIGTLVIGFRYPLVLGLIACGTIWLNRMPPMRFLVRCWALVPLLALGGTFFCVYKQVQWNLKAGYLERVYEALIDPDTYLMSIVKSEPFITQTILNEVLERDYRLDPTYLLGNAFQLLPGTQMFGGTVVSFNDQFQPALFP